MSLHVEALHFWLFLIEITDHRRFSSKALKNEKACKYLQILIKIRIIDKYMHEKKSRSLTRLRRCTTKDKGKPIDSKKALNKK